MILPLSLALLMGFLEAGRWLGRRHGGEAEANLTTLEGSVLGLFALIVGFTFSMALSHFDDRRAALLVEANAIGTAALRARLLPDAEAAESLDLLRRYAALRHEFAASGGAAMSLGSVIARSGEMQEALWRIAESAAARDNAMVPGGLYLQALNDMFDAQEARLTAFRVRLHPVVLLAIFVIGSAATGLVGYSAGVTGRRRSPPGYLVTGLMVLVIVFLVDLDEPSAGAITVDQQPMRDTIDALAGYRP
jgi:hypothetical protein